MRNVGRPKLSVYECLIAKNELRMGMMNAERGTVIRRPGNIPTEVADIIAWTLMVMGFFQAAYGIPNFISVLRPTAAAQPIGSGIITEGAFALMGSSMLIAGVAIRFRATRLMSAVYAVTSFTFLQTIAFASCSYPSLAKSGLGLLRVSLMLFASLAPLATGVATILLLRRMQRRNAAQQAPPVCQHCGYLMRGLYEPRCPECGRVYTLDEFHAL